MPQRQPRAAISAAERPLLEAYARAWERVTRLQEAFADNPAEWRRRERLERSRRAIERELDRLDAAALKWFQEEFPRVHAMGVNSAARELLAPAAQVWGAINPEAVARLANEGFDDLLKSTRGVRRTTKALIREIVGDETLQKMIQGDTATAAARRARQILEKKGVYAVKYKDGSTHGLREYANMAVRTKTAQAYNLGTVEAGRTQGVTRWEIFDGDCGLTAHDGPSCNGLVVDGDVAMAHPISHPNCQRAFGGRPDLSPDPPRRTDQELAGMTDEERRLARNEASRRSKAKAKAAKEAAARNAVRPGPSPAAESDLQRVQREIRETRQEILDVQKARRDIADRAPASVAREASTPPPAPKKPNGWPPPPRAKGRSVDQTKRLPPDRPATAPDAPDFETQLARGLPRLGDDRRTASEALRGANPRYNDDPQYRVNCTNAVTSYELRRRGYDVEAAPLEAGRTGRTVQEFMDAWGGDARYVADNPAIDRQDLVDRIRAEWPDGGRGFVMVQYGSGLRRGGHIFSVEYQNGKVHWIDPQTGQAFNESDNYMFSGVVDRVMYGRLDDLSAYDELRGFLA